MVGPKRANFSAVLLVTCVMSAGCASEDKDIRPSDMKADTGETLDSGLGDMARAQPEDATPVDAVSNAFSDLGLPDWGVTIN